MNDTIAAVSTALGEAAISVLRVSGPDATALLSRVFRPASPMSHFPSRRAIYGSIVDAQGAVVDTVLVTCFEAPASYTGEDVAEISCHGGLLVTRRVFDLLLAQGARAAEPGEFTQRAFLNGKMDLTQAEAVMDLIHARSELALQAAHEQLSGRLGRHTEIMREDLIGLTAHIEAYIDFPEEDIDPDTGAAMQGRIEKLRGQLRDLLATAEQGRILRAGARTVICGEPNAGKSSLLNTLAGFDRAIVSAKAGTTRDTIEEVLHIHGLPFVMVDTAGLRENSTDDIEMEGMERTGREMAHADVILEVVDASLPRESVHRVGIPAGKRGHLLVLNKQDQGIHESWRGIEDGIPFSSLTGDGLDALRAAMRDAVWQASAGYSSQLVAINARHQASFAKAAAALERAGAAMDRREAPEHVALDVREALQAVGEVTGRVDVEEILGAIFSQFCIGK